MKDTDEEVIGEYQIPEMETTVPGCTVYYKVFLQSAKNDNLTETTTPIALVDTLTTKRTIKFKVNRNLIGVSTLFFIEGYIPRLTASGLF
jgi:hypothetical protein